MVERDKEGLLELIGAAYDRSEEDARALAGPLAQALSHDEIEVRRLAAWALGELGKEGLSAEPALLDALSTPNPELRADALRALGALGQEASEAGQDAIWDAGFEDPAWQCRLAVVEVASGYARDFLCASRLVDEDLRVCLGAAKRLRGLKRPLGVVEALRDPRPEVRLLAYWILQRASPEYARRSESLAALRSLDRARRIKAAWQLREEPPWILERVPGDPLRLVEVPDQDRRLPYAFRELLPGLIRGAFAAKSPVWRSACRRVLLDLGALSRVAAPWLLRETWSQDREVRWEAVDSLVRIGTPSSVTIPVLTKAAAEPELPFARLLRIFQSAAAFYPEASLEILGGTGAARADPGQRLRLLRVVGNTALPRLKESNPNAARELRRSSAARLAKVAARAPSLWRGVMQVCVLIRGDSITILAGYVEGDSSQEVKIEALSALGRCSGEARAVAPLLRALAGPSPDLSEAAARALAHHGDEPEVVLGLAAAVAESEDKMTRISSIRSLARIGEPRSVPALGALARAASGDDEDVRTCAAWALRGVGADRLSSPRPQLLWVVPAGRRSHLSAGVLLLLAWCVLARRYTRRRLRSLWARGLRAGIACGVPALLVGAGVGWVLTPTWTRFYLPAPGQLNLLGPVAAACASAAALAGLIAAVAILWPRQEADAERDLLAAVEADERLRGIGPIEGDPPHAGGD